MEYAAGGELLHRIRKRLRLPNMEAKFYAAEIADALQYMHNEVSFVYRTNACRILSDNLCHSGTMYQVHALPHRQNSIFEKQR